MPILLKTRFVISKSIELINKSFITLIPQNRQLTSLQIIIFVCLAPLIFFNFLFIINSMFLPKMTVRFFL